VAGCGKQGSAKGACPHHLSLRTSASIPPASQSIGILHLRSGHGRKRQFKQDKNASSTRSIINICYLTTRNPLSPCLTTSKLTSRPPCGPQISTANFAPIQRSPAKSHYYRSSSIPRHYCLGAAHQAFTEKIKRNTNTPAANDGFPSAHEVVALSSFAILLSQENDDRRREYSCASPRQSPGEKMLHYAF